MVYRASQSLLLVRDLMCLRANTNYANLFAQLYSVNTLHKDENANLESMEKPLKTTYHTWECKQARHFLKCCTVNITRRDVREKSREYCDSWLTCRKIHKHAGPGCAVNRRKLLPILGTQSHESHFSALSIHSLLGELNYIRSNLVSHLFSSSGQETYLHEVAVGVYL